MKRIISILVFLLICLSLGAVSTDWFYNTLNSKEKVLYERIEEAIMSNEEKIMDVDFSSKECLRIYSGYLDDHPGIFWVDNKISYGTYLDSNGKAKHSINLVFTHTENLNADKVRFVNLVSKFSGYLQRDPNDWIKLYHIYDYLASTIEYSLDYMDQTMWSVFFEGIGVCAGFARSFQYLALQEGIPSVVVHGYAKNEDGSQSDVGHLWVMAKIGDNWYHFDPTWGLQDNDGVVDFTYFCRSSKRMELSHVIDNDYPIPSSLDDTMSYVNMRGRNMKQYSRGSYKEILKKAVSNDEYSFTVEFGSASELEKAVKDLFQDKGLTTIVRELGLTGAKSYSYINDKQTMALQLTLKF